MRILTLAVFSLLLGSLGCSVAPQSDVPIVESGAGDSAANENDNSAAENQPNSQPGDLESFENGSWEYFRGNAQSTGVAVSGLPAELSVLWEYKVPDGAFEATPTVVREQDGSKKTVYIGDLDGSLFALDLQTGEMRWEFKSEIGFVTAPVVRDNRIFIGDIDGIFYCLNEAGEKVWSFQTDGEINSSANFYQDNVLVGSQDFHLYALNVNSGELAWKYESQDQIRCSATVAGDRAFVAGCDGFFHVINLESGTEVGSTDIRSPTGATPAA